MEELAYTLSDGNGGEVIYTIVEYASEDTFDFMPNGETVRRVQKQGGKWIQVAGDDTSPEILDEMGRFMEKHHRQQKEDNQ